MTQRDGFSISALSFSTLFEKTSKSDWQISTDHQMPFQTSSELVFVLCFGSFPSLRILQFLDTALGDLLINENGYHLRFVLTGEESTTSYSILENMDAGSDSPAELQDFISAIESQIFKLPSNEEVFSNRKADKWAGNFGLMNCPEILLGDCILRPQFAPENLSTLIALCMLCISEKEG